MDMLQIALTLLDIVDATATAFSLLALAEMWRQRGQAGEGQKASNVTEIERFIDLTRTHAQPHW